MNLKFMIFVYKKSRSRLIIAFNAGDESYFLRLMFF